MIKALMVVPILVSLMAGTPDKLDDAKLKNIAAQFLISGGVNDFFKGKFGAYRTKGHAMIFANGNLTLTLTESGHVASYVDSSYIFRERPQSQPATWKIKNLAQAKSRMLEFTRGAKLDTKGLTAQVNKRMETDVRKRPLVTYVMEFSKPSKTKIIDDRGRMVELRVPVVSIQIEPETGRLVEFDDSRQVFKNIDRVKANKPKST